MIIGGMSAAQIISLKKYASLAHCALIRIQSLSSVQRPGVSVVPLNANIVFACP